MKSIAFGDKTHITQACTSRTLNPLALRYTLSALAEDTGLLETTSQTVTFSGNGLAPTKTTTTSFSSPVSHQREPIALLDALDVLQAGGA